MEIVEEYSFNDKEREFSLKEKIRKSLSSCSGGRNLLGWFESFLKKMSELGYRLYERWKREIKRDVMKIRLSV